MKSSIECSFAIIGMDKRRACVVPQRQDEHTSPLKNMVLFRNTTPIESAQPPQDFGVVGTGNKSQGLLKSTWLGSSASWSFLDLPYSHGSYIFCLDSAIIRYWVLHTGSPTTPFPVDASALLPR